MRASDEYASDDGMGRITGDVSGEDASVDQVPDDIDDTRVAGTILEAAFVDPAYQWPPPDGQGKNAIELKASQSLMADLDDPNKVFDKESQTFVAGKKYNHQQNLKPGQKGVRTVRTVVQDQSYRGFWCCKWNVKNQVHENIQEDPFAVDRNGNMVSVPESASPDGAVDPAGRDPKEELRASRYGKVPEGILIYRLNTTTRRLELLSEPHNKTNMDTLVRDMVIAKASPSTGKTRRGMDLTGEDGTKTTLVACEQRTAIAWLEVLDMILKQSVST